MPGPGGRQRAAAAAVRGLAHAGGDGVDLVEFGFAAHRGGTEVCPEPQRVRR